MATSNLAPPRLTQIAVIGAAVIAVADVCLKHAARQRSLANAVRSPWAWAAVALDLIQVALFAIVFVHGWKLSIVGVIQTTLDIGVTVGAGVLLFNEASSFKQVLGLAYAVISVVFLTS